MNRIVMSLLFVAGCGIKSGTTPPVVKGMPCEGDCPSGYQCLIGRDGSLTCQDRCTSHSECGTDSKCEDGKCKACESAGCGEIGDGGVGDIPAAASGCKSGIGRIISATMHACLAMATQPDDVRKQCAQGWSICKTNTAGDACEMMLPRNEIYIAEAINGQPSGNPWNPPTIVPRWNGLGSTYLRGIAGCGNGVGAISGYFPIVGGFQWAIECQESDRPPQIPNVVECPRMNGDDTDFRLVRILHPRAGVLCCKP